MLRSRRWAPGRGCWPFLARSVARSEQRNLAESQPEEAARLTALVNDYLERPQVAWGAPHEVEINELERGQLRALGYIFH
jgi:hypothetical protein